MLAVDYSARAAQDLLQVVESECKVSSERATRVLDDIESGIELLRQFPGMASHPRPPATDRSMRVWHVDNWAIFFRVRGSILEIVRILPSRSDLSRPDLF